MLYDLNPNGTFGCDACWVSKMSFLTLKHKRKRMAEWKSKEWQSMYVKNPMKRIKNHRGTKDGVSFSLKSYAILRKYKVYIVFLFPKPYTFLFFFLTKISPSVPPFCSATFSSYSMRNVAGCTRTYVLLSFSFINPNTAITSTIL